MKNKKIFQVNLSMFGEVLIVIGISNLAINRTQIKNQIQTSNIMNYTS